MTLSFAADTSIWPGDACNHKTVLRTAYKNFMRDGIVQRDRSDLRPSASS